MELLKKTLALVLEELAAKNLHPLDAGPEEWLKKALTKKELGHIKVRYFSKGVLGLNVDSSVWLYMLSLKKTELLTKLQKEYSGLKNINFRIGEIK